MRRASPRCSRPGPLPLGAEPPRREQRPGALQLAQHGHRCIFHGVAGRTGRLEAPAGHQCLHLVGGDDGVALKPRVVGLLLLVLLVHVEPTQTGHHDVALVRRDRHPLVQDASGQRAGQQIVGPFAGILTEPFAGVVAQASGKAERQQLRRAAKEGRLVVEGHAPTVASSCPGGGTGVGGTSRGRRMGSPDSSK